MTVSTIQILCIYLAFKSLLTIYEKRYLKPKSPMAGVTCNVSSRWRWTGRRWVEISTWPTRRCCPPALVFSPSVRLEHAVIVLIRIFDIFMCNIYNKYCRPQSRRNWCRIISCCVLHKYSKPSGNCQTEKPHCVCGLLNPFFAHNNKQTLLSVCVLCAALTWSPAAAAVSAVVREPSSCAAGPGWSLLSGLSHCPMQSAALFRASASAASHQTG